MHCVFTCSVCINKNPQQHSRLKELYNLEAMTKPRKTGIFTFDQRGWSSLYKHIEKQLDTKRLDIELCELHFSGTRVKTRSDSIYLAKITTMFAGIKTVGLKDMGLENLDAIGQLLCTKFLRTKLLDVSGNNLSKDQLKKFIDALEGRSITKEVPPIWLAIGEISELFTKNFACCNPHTYGGCICKQKRVVHVGRDLNSLLYSKAMAAVAKQCPQRPLPPPPNEAPPPPPFMACVGIFNSAKHKFQLAFENEKPRWNVIQNQGKEFVLVQCEGKLEFVNFMQIDSGCVPSILGDVLQMKDMNIVPAAESIPATTLSYSVDAECTTPDSYLSAFGGENIWIRAASYADGWVAATFDQSEWKWFPLSNCLL
jgi:hypothetical protein